MQKVTVDKKIGYAVAFAVLAASLLAFFVPSGYVPWVGAVVFAIAAAATCTTIRKRSIPSYNSRQVLLIVSVVAVLYLTLYYLSGLSYGFVISSKGKLTFESFVKYVIPFTATVISSEIVRSVLLAEKSKPITLISYVIGVVSVIACAGGVPSFRSAYVVADFFGMTVIPALTANLLYTYISQRYGPFSNVSYRLILTLYSYFIPMISGVPRILPAFVLLVLPVVVQAFLDALFEKKIKQAKQKESKWRFVFPIVSGILMVGIVMLITCQFRFGILVIATGSMSGEIEMGDAVVFESYEYCDSAKENDVIVFEENGRQVVHRVVDVMAIDGQRQYITKGDANDGVDAGFRTDQQIVGIVRLKVRYIGYPSLWMRQIFVR